MTVSNLLFCLMNRPHLKNAHGTGINASAMKPSKLLAQPMPRLRYTAAVSLQ